MYFIVTFNITHSDDTPYEKVYEVFEEKFSLLRHEMQDDRKILTPTTTVIGESSKHSTSNDLSEAIRDEFMNYDIVFDRLLVCKTDDHLLIG